MIRTEIDIVIDRPAEAVFDVLSDLSRNPTWQNGMKSCVWTSDPPVGVGSSYEQIAEFAGREIRSTFEVAEYEPGSRIKATTIESSFPITFTRWVEAIDDSTTRVRAIIEGDASGFFRLMERFMAPMVRRSIRGDYARLKALLEEA